MPRGQNAIPVFAPTELHERREGGIEHLKPSCNDLCNIPSTNAHRAKSRNKGGCDVPERRL
eukprot:scaffold666914_cov47-Prasinocladus_malaysianus.AAC.1